MHYFTPSRHNSRGVLVGGGDIILKTARNRLKWSTFMYKLWIWLWFWYIICFQPATGGFVNVRVYVNFWWKTAYLRCFKAVCNTYFALYFYFMMYNTVLNCAVFHFRPFKLILIHKSVKYFYFCYLKAMISIHIM